MLSQQMDNPGRAAVASGAATDARAAGRVAGLIASLSSAERGAMKLHLSEQITCFFDDHNALACAAPGQRVRFDLLADTLRALTPDGSDIPVNGIAWRGRPDWLSAASLHALQQEAAQRRTEPLDRIDHYLGCGGRCADALSVSPAVLDFVSRHVGPVRPTGIASYLYYDRAGLGIRPHIDTEVFSVNLMIMLRHDHPPGVERSATVVFPAHRNPESYRLDVGEAMLMHGSSIIHTRSPVKAGEHIHLLTFGFQRL